MVEPRVRRLPLAATVLPETVRECADLDHALGERAGRQTDEATSSDCVRGGQIGSPMTDWELDVSKYDVKYDRDRLREILEQIKQLTDEALVLFKIADNNKDGPLVSDKTAYDD